MENVSGIVYSEGRFFEGFVEIDQGKITAISEGKPSEKSKAEGLILPLLADCHTHIGDTYLRGKIDLSLPLEKIVRPPDGIKHIMLAKSSDENIQKSMGRAIDEMNKGGIGRFIDFREGGQRGLMQARKAIANHQYPLATILSRPEKLDYSEKEIDRLLKDSDGIGVSSISDWPYDELDRIAEQANSNGKIFAIHASEAVREDIGKVLDLRPDFLIHMAKATNDDLRACKDENIPIVVCPRSNARFGIKLDISRMIDSGVTVCLGTDNSMFDIISMTEELKVAFELQTNSRPLTAEEVFKLAIDNAEKVLNDKNFISIRPGNPCELMVVRAGKKYDPDNILRAGGKCSIEYKKGGIESRGSANWRKSRKF